MSFRITLCCLGLWIAASAPQTEAATPTGRGESKRKPMPELRLDLRAVGHGDPTVEHSPSGLDVRPNTTRWLAGLPDSLLARVPGHFSRVRVSAFLAGDRDTVEVLVQSPRGLIRRARAPATDSGRVAIWNWDLRDSARVRVPEGLYVVSVISGDRVVHGYVLVGRRK